MFVFKLAPVQGQDVLIEKDGLRTCHGLIEFLEQVLVQFDTHVASSHPNQLSCQGAGATPNFQNRVR
jgi:hypothetical protein